MNKNIRRIGVFAIALVVIMVFVSASNFTEGIGEGCELVGTCEDVLVGVSCVNKTIENCEDVCSIGIVEECHEEISENGSSNEVCEDVERKICERINCFKEVIENCDGIIEQKECITETICNVPNESLSSEKVVGEMQNDSVKNFTEVNDSLNLNESLEFINNITLNASITNISETQDVSWVIQNLTILNETGSFYWAREIVNEYGDVNESIPICQIFFITNSNKLSVSNHLTPNIILIFHSIINIRNKIIALI